MCRSALRQSRRGAWQGDAADSLAAGEKYKQETRMWDAETMHSSKGLCIAPGPTGNCPL